MLKLYIFWGTFVLVLIGVGLTLLSQHNRRRKNRNAAAESAARAIPGTSPAAGAADAPFDPNATRIHVRTSPASESAALLLNRENASLPANASVRLVCVGGAQKGESFAIRSGGVTVGRDAKNDIVIQDSRVSYHHAWIGIVDQKVLLRDLESTNGTFLNAQLDSLVQEVALIHGDTIFFGGHGGAQFRVVVE
ncbi:MAG: FHA domain-containing protein [Betaproteobacteria bacterium]|nr:FHA domain-containing protein [Betaproteobacteria bacterium]